LISAGAPPQTPLQELTASTDPLVGFKGPASKGREGRKDGMEGQGERKAEGRRRGGRK